MRYLKIIAPVICFFIVELGFSQVGEVFPDITGESLKNTSVKLPESSKGKYCLIGVSSSLKAEEDLQTWMQPVYDMFIHQNTFIPIDYTLDIYFIPMFTGTNQTIYTKVFDKTKAEIDAELAPHVLFYKGNIGVYKEKLKLIDKSTPYFFVLDKTGKIVYTTSGIYTQKKLEKIESLIPQE